MLSLLACGEKRGRSFPSTATNVEESTEEETTEEECINDDDFFAQEVWAKSLSPVCYSCHNTQGTAILILTVLIS